VGACCDGKRMDVIDEIGVGDPVQACPDERRGGSQTGCEGPASRLSAMDDQVSLPVETT